MVLLRCTAVLAMILFASCSSSEGNIAPADIVAPSDALAAETNEEDSGLSEDVTPDVHDPTEAAFEADRLLEIAVEIAPDDWEELCQQTRTFADILQGDCLAQPFEKIFTYFPGTVTIDGELFENVGVRKKGFFGSLSNTKPSLKIKFEEYQEGPRFSGLDRLTLNNSNQDPSHMNTCLVYKVYRDAGYPAPRCNFARVTVNGEYLGVYIHVDSVKKPYLKRLFGDDDGNLYEGQLSDFSETFRNTFEKKTNNKEDDWSDLDAATSAMGTPGDMGLSLLEGIFDIDSFLTFWAIEVLIGHWDGYNGNLNNFYLYADPTTEKFVFLPWGPDSAFAEVNNPFDDYDYPASVMANSTLSRRLYEDPDYREAYRGRLTELLGFAWNEETLIAEVDRIEGLIEPHIPADQLSQFATQVKRIRKFIDEQRGKVESSLAENPDFTNAEREAPCFVSTGSVAGSFETTYGTLKAPNALELGSVTYDHFVFQGNDIVPQQSGAVVGLETNEPNAGKIILSMVNLIGGNIDVLAFIVDSDKPQAGVKIPVGKGGIQGFALRFKGGGFEILANLAGGWLQFDEFEASEGATVKGSFDVKIY